MPIVTNYEITFYGFHSTSSGGSSSGPLGGFNNLLAEIMLYHNDEPFGMIQFFLDGTPIPEDFTGSGGITMHVPYSMFEDIYTALRNEKPVVLEYRTVPVGEGAVLTLGKNEPVGEND